MTRHIAAIAAVVAIVAGVPVVASAQQGGPMGAMGQNRPFTLEQMQQGSDMRFTALDTNKDGALSTAEMTPPPTPGSMMSAGRGMERADANRDGTVTLEEYHTMMAGMFARMDANQDGTVTPDEIQAMRGAMRSGGGQGGGMPGGGVPGGGMPSGGMQMPDGN